MSKKTKVTIIKSLYNCQKYLSGYFEAVEGIVNKEDCEFLLLHNAPTKDELESLQLINHGFRIL